MINNLAPKFNRQLYLILNSQKKRRKKWKERKKRRREWRDFNRNQVS